MDWPYQVNSIINVPYMSSSLCVYGRHVMQGKGQYFGRKMMWTSLTASENAWTCLVLVCPAKKLTHFGAVCHEKFYSFLFLPNSCAGLSWAII